MHPFYIMTIQNLTELRNILLALHKELLEYQKQIYEATVGPINSPNQYYNLVVNDSNFAWLRTLSALVISIDEALEAKQAPDVKTIRGIFSYTKKLLTATGFGDTFETHYVTAIQKNAHVSLMHGKIMQLLQM